MFNDLSDTGLLPEEGNSSDTIIIDPSNMSWMIKSSNFSCNTSASVMFQLSSYEGEELSMPSDIFIMVQNIILVGKF